AHSLRLRTHLLLSSLFSLSLFLYLSAHPRHLHSFPTRRSSDLCPSAGMSFTSASNRPFAKRFRTSSPPASATASKSFCERTVRRSEEHTSELQSHLNLVCRLLLEKKKKPRTLRFSIRTQHYSQP